jgi:hypothetical protein
LNHDDVTWDYPKKEEEKEFLNTVFGKVGGAIGIS